MFNSQYYTCEQIDERLLQGYLDDYNTQMGQSLTKEQFLTKLGNIFAKEILMDNVAVNIGYFVCDTAAGTVDKVLTVAGYELFQGGSIKVKFINRNTASSATLNINSKGAKALYYGGKPVSASNSWDNGEVVEIYYDGTSYYANNVEGNFKDGIFDISAYNLTGDQPTKYATLAEALGTNGDNVPPIFRKGGMQIKYVRISDNKYVQYRLMSDTFNITPANWQGIDDVPTAESDNPVKSGGVFAEFKSLGDDLNLLTRTGTEITGTSATNLRTPVDFIAGYIFYINEGTDGENFSTYIDGIHYYIAKVSGIAGSSLIDPNLFDNVYSSAEAVRLSLKYRVVEGAVYDVSAKNPTAGPNNDGKFASLSALLSDTNLNTLIPTAARKGGMSIKFIQSSDNKYVQYRCMATSFSVNVVDWQDTSSNMVEILDTAIYGMNETAHSGWTADNGTIIDNGGTFYVVPVEPNSIVKVAANTTSSAIVCVVSNYTDTSFTFATGYSARLMIAANTVSTETLPSDAHYLLISGSLNTINYLPSVLVINGIDILNKYANTQNGTKSNSSLINGISKYDIRDGWPGDNGTIVNNGGKHRIIPVNTGQVLSVTANNGKNALIFIISDYSSSSFHFADGYAARWSVTKGTTGNVILPLNAKYILVSTTLSGNDYTPSNLTIDGVDVNTTIQEIAETNTEVERKNAKNSIAIFSLNSAKQYDGWIGDNGTIDTTRGKYKVIPIENGDSVKIVANSSKSAIIGVAKEFTPASIVFATGYTGRWITTAGNTDTDIMPSDAHYLLVSISLNDNDYTPLSLQINGYEYMETSTSMIERINSSLNVKEVHCWGDSLTWAGEYENGIANVLGLATDKVINFGLGSDYSSHIRRRMLSYYQDTTPYTGNTSSSVRPYYDGSKTLVERQQSLRDAFILIFMGTNNIIRQGGRSPQYTLNSAAYKAQVMALYPEATDDNWTTFVNWDFDKAMAQAYKDYMLQDLHDMVSIIPHNHWAIITGHGINPADVNNDYLQTMEEVDKLITMTYPDNVINIKQLMQANYEYGGMSVAEDFVKPAVNSSVSIKLNTVALLSSFSGVTGGDRICIGTKKEYDTYEVESIDSANNTITAKLIANNASYWGVGDTVRAENALISDNGVDVVMLPTRVYMRMDIQSWNIDEMPRTTCQGDHVHPVNYYYAMGELIGKEIKKIQ